MTFGVEKYNIFSIQRMDWKSIEYKWWVSNSHIKRMLAQVC